MATNLCSVTHAHCAYAFRHKPYAQHRDHFSSPVSTQAGGFVDFHVHQCTSKHAFRSPCSTALRLPLQFCFAPMQLPATSRKQKKKQKKKAKKAQAKAGVPRPQTRSQNAALAVLPSQPGKCNDLDAVLHLLSLHASASLLYHPMQSLAPQFQGTLHVSSVILEGVHGTNKQTML